MRSNSAGLSLCAIALATATATAVSAAPLITGPIDETALVTVTGERSPYLAQATDLGALADAQTLDHVMLVLKRPPAMQAALDRLVRDQTVPTSPSFHQWLKPGALRGYGPAQPDIDMVAGWLRGRGLRVNAVSPSGMAIDFRGSVGAIAAAFHTTLHHVRLAGEDHIANMTDIALPAALAPVVRGATLANFFARPNVVRRSEFTIHNGPSSLYAVGPTDFATIYNVNPLLSGNNLYGVRIAGFGVTIAVVEQTDILAADWQTFRHSFGLDKSRGTLAMQHPGCSDPGTTQDEIEAALDAQWAGAAAPDAAIIEASCPATATTFGVETALQGLVEGGTTASVLSISYGGDEIGEGLTFLTGWQNLLEEGAAEGLSIMVSSGDAGTSAIRGGISYAGVAVNGLSSNPYNTAVGGTDFLDTALNQNALYWSATNSAGLSSAKSYIPETPWDNSCAGAVLVAYTHAASAIASCNVRVFPAYEQQGVGGTGGQSIYYAKPAFQNGVPGVPADGVRDQPDVSLFAASGLWGHALIFCMSDPQEGGTPCDYAVKSDIYYNSAGGTSFAAPAFAGMAALIVQARGQLEGNLAPRLYAIATSQFTQPLLAADCNASLGRKISSACVFNTVTTGNIAEPCYAGTPDCYTDAAASRRIGVLRVPGIAGDAFPAQPGYSLATGLGSVNALNLIYNY